MHVPPAIVAIAQRTSRGASKYEVDVESVHHCPVCDGQNRTLLYEGLRDRTFGSVDGEWRLHHCLECGAAYLDPRPTPTTLGRAYAGYYTHLPPAGERSPRGLAGRARAAIRNGYLNRTHAYRLSPSAETLGPALATLVPAVRAGAERYVRSLSQREGGRLLEIGCGNGGFLARMRDLGRRGTGIEPDPDAVSAARIAGLDVRRGELTPESVPAGSFEAATMSHVIEHVHEPRILLESAFRALRPGGTLWIATPNLTASGHRRYGRDWLHLDPPRHLVLFTIGSLARLVRAVGFEVLVAPPPARQAAGSYAASERLAREASPFAEEKVPLATRWRAALADLALGRRPDLSEELVLIARRPDEPPA